MRPKSNGSSIDDVLKIYYSDISHFNLLTTEQELSMLRKTCDVRDEFFYASFKYSPISAYNFIFSIAEQLEARKIRPNLVINHYKKGDMAYFNEKYEALKEVRKRLVEARNKYGIGYKIRSKEVVDNGKRILKGINFAPSIFYALNKYIKNNSSTDRTARKAIDEKERDYYKLRNSFCNSNLRLVIKIAKKYSHPKLSLTDLIQEGNIGLLEALDRFDYRVGVRFSTYGFWWIRQAITRHIINNYGNTKVAIHSRELALSLDRSKYRLSIKLGREATAEDIATYRDMRLEDVEKLLHLDDISISLDERNSNGTSLIDFLADNTQPDNIKILDRELIRKIIEDQLRNLQSRDRIILMENFGFDCEEASLKEIGDSNGVTRERMRQIKIRALNKLRKSKVLRDLWKEL